MKEGEGMEGGSGILHMTKVLFGEVKVLICGHTKAAYGSDVN
jgi:hypothetical protein